MRWLPLLAAVLGATWLVRRNDAFEQAMTNLLADFETEVLGLLEDFQNDGLFVASPN